MSKTKRAYKYRFYPTDEQKRILAQTFGCCRFVYNWGLSTRKTAYSQDGQKLTYNDLSAMLPTLKKEHPWLADVSSVPIQQSLRHLDKAYKNFFEGRAKYPTFKKRHGTQSATYASNAFTWENGQLTLAIDLTVEALPELDPFTDDQRAGAGNLEPEAAAGEDAVRDDDSGVAVREPGDPDPCRRRQPRGGAPPEVPCAPLPVRRREHWGIVE